jgi:hypothetical protein
MNTQRARPTRIAQGGRAGELPRVSGSSTALSRCPRLAQGEATQKTSSSVGLWKQGSSGMVPETHRHASRRALTEELCVHSADPWNQFRTFGSPSAVHGL